jgi:ABC-2 type transport system permease protein
MTAAVRVLSQSARLGIDDFRSVYTWKSWLAGWLLRMLAQVAFFGSIGLLIGSRAEIGYLLGRAVPGHAAAVRRQPGQPAAGLPGPRPPLDGDRAGHLGRHPDPAAAAVRAAAVPLRVLACLPVLVVVAVSSYCYGSFLASLVARFPQFNWLALNVGYLAVMTVAGVNVPVDFWPGPVQAVANLLPVTHGLLAVRLLLDGGGLAAAAPQVGAELLVAVGWLAASWLSYRRFFRRARMTGSFDVG